MQEVKTHRGKKNKKTVGTAQTGGLRLLFVFYIQKFEEMGYNF
jgi:hypothetical protein